MSDETGVQPEKITDTNMNEPAVAEENTAEAVAEEIELDGMNIFELIQLIHNLENDYRKQRQYLKTEKIKYQIETDFKAMGLTNKEMRDGYVNNQLMEMVEVDQILKNRLDHYHRIYESMHEFKLGVVPYELITNPLTRETQNRLEKLIAIIKEKEKKSKVGVQIGEENQSTAKEGEAETGNE